MIEAFFFIQDDHLAVKTRSSILRIILTQSVARVRALWVTKAGYKTFSVLISSLIFPFLIEIPAY